MSTPLADLHVHLYGAISAPAWHRIVANYDDVDWSWYEQSFVAAYGRSTDMAATLRRHHPESTEWRDHFEFAARDAGDFDRFQAKFNALIAGSALSRLDGSPARARDVDNELRAVVTELAATQRHHGVDYAEYRMLFGPRHAPAVVEAAAHTICAAMAELADAPMRLALSLPRVDPWPIWAVAQRVATSAVGTMLTAIDFCGAEEGHPPLGLAPLLADVRRFNAATPKRALAVLVHVGESYRDKSLESAVRWVHQAALVGADRLGHALALGIDPADYDLAPRSESVAERRDQIAYDLAHARVLRDGGVAIDEDALQTEQHSLRSLAPEQSLEVIYDAARVEQVRRRQAVVMHDLRARGTVIEVCPTSNQRIANLRDLARHPLPRLLAVGLPVVVGSDDPGLLGTSLSRELDVARHEIGIDAAAIDEMRARAWSVRSERLAGRTRQ